MNKSLWILSLFALLGVGRTSLALTPEDPALVGVWLFEEGTGRTSADLKNGNNANLTSSIKWDTGKFGNAVRAEGTGTISVRNSATISSISEQLTVAGWFRIDADSDTGIRKDGSFLLEDQSATEPIPNGFSFRIWTDQGLSPGIYGKTELNQGEWYHIAGTYDGSKMELYVNGQPESANGLLTDQSADTDGAWGGNIAPGSPLQLKFSSESLIGAMDEVVILNRALTAEEVQQLVSGWASLGPKTPGDVNGDGQADVADLDALAAAIRGGSTQAVYDLNKDGTVNSLDHRAFIVDIKKTWVGDANLNGTFDSADFVAVFQVGEYEDTAAENSGWAEGDWNGDAEFNSSDFVAAFQDGGFEAGPRPAVAAVPEPALGFGLVMALGVLASRRRR